MPSVLFICAANICRSPMAQGLLTAKTMETGEAWMIDSAGIYVKPGFPPAPYTLEILREKEIDLSAHRSRMVNAELVAQFDLILTMERGQKEALRAAFPQHKHKIYLLSEMVGQNQDIIDPIGQPFIDYQQTAQEIDGIIRFGFVRIRSLASISDDEQHG